MTEILQYHIFQSPTAFDLVDKVNKHIQEGWVPIGGVSVTIGGNANRNLWAQAMVRYKENFIKFYSHSSEHTSIEEPSVKVEIQEEK